MNKEKGFFYFEDGKNLQIEELINSRYSCAIALEEMNSFIVTGGLSNGIG